MPFDLSQFDPAPKWIKRSPFLATDPIAEATLGTTGAILVPMSCMVLRGGKHPVEDGFYKTAFYGSFFHGIDPTNGDGQLQMWFGTMMFLPEVKFRDGFAGMRADQILCSGFSSPQMWKELILDNT